MSFSVEIPDGSPFTIDNIPFGVIRTAKDPKPRCASAIGGYAIDLASYAQGGRLDAVETDGHSVHVFEEV